MWEKLAAPRSAASAIRGNSVKAPSSSNNDMLKVPTVVQQYMIEFSEVVSEKEKIMVLTEIVQ